MKKTRILLLTDSLSLPRKYPGGRVTWEQCYVNLLRLRMPEVEFIHVGIGGATIRELLRLQNYYELTEPDIVVLHCGIVDCAPRALGEIELQIVKKLHLYRLVKPLSRFLRDHRGLTYTPLSEFESALRELRERFSSKPFIAIGILPGTPDYERVAPGISRNIASYNQVLAQHTDFISCDDFPRDGIAPDHHHLNAVGHAGLSDRLYPKLEMMVAADRPVS